MATTQIADIYNPLTFARRATEAQIQLNAFIASGVMSNDVALAAQAAAGGNTGEMTNYKPMVYSEPNYSSDDPAQLATTDKVESAVMKYRKYFGNRAWSFMDLARMVNLQQGPDPVGVVTTQIGQYWANVEQTRAIRTSLGILADSVANHGGDMVKSVATDDAGAVTDAERINADVVLDAKQTLGDHASKITAIAMHSVVKTRLQKQNLIDYIPDARGEVMIPTYLGYRIIEDDEMPAVAGTNRITYTCVLFAPGALGYANVPTLNASTTDRIEEAGNGGGEDRVWSRTSGIIHPLGYTWTDASVAGNSATWAELENAANWTRVWDRKNIPMAFIQVND